MAAPTVPYNDVAKIGDVQAPPYLVRKSLNNAQTLTVTFLNVTQVIVVHAAVTMQLMVHSGGVAAHAYFDLPAGIPVALPIQTKLLRITNASGGAGAVSVCATLSPIRASEWPTLSETAFDGVQSHNSAVVA